MSGLDKVEVEVDLVRQKSAGSVFFVIFLFMTLLEDVSSSKQRRKREGSGKGEFVSGWTTRSFPSARLVLLPPFFR